MISQYEAQKAYDNQSEPDRELDDSELAAEWFDGLTMAQQHHYLYEFIQCDSVVVAGNPSSGLSRVMTVNMGEQFFDWLAGTDDFKKALPKLEDPRD